MALVSADPDLELEVDLPSRLVRAGGEAFAFSMPDGPRKAFIEGTWDSTFELLGAKEAIEKTARGIAYLRAYEA